LLYKEIARPNGRLTPDEKYMYLNNSDASQDMSAFRIAIMESGNEKIFFDMTHDSSDGVPDGMKVDQRGKYRPARAVSDFTPKASTCEPSSRLKLPVNLHWGDADAKTL
jgi:gluconolactonase